MLRKSLTYSKEILLGVQILHVAAVIGYCFKIKYKTCNREVYAKSEKSAEVASTCIKETFLHQCETSCSKDCSKSSLWICFTCHRKIISGEIPPEAAANNM